jgi:hypothetical protein
VCAIDAKGLMPNGLGDRTASGRPASGREFGVRPFTITE